MKTVELVTRLKCITKKNLMLSRRQFPSSDLKCYRMRSQHELLNTNSRDDGNLNRKTECMRNKIFKRIHMIES